jgi:hypothetical protein
MYYNNKFLKKEMIKKGGYIALMATIIISLVLLVMTVEEGSSGWYSRFNILGTEAKEQANALAEGCADQALASIVTDPAYFGDATTTTVGGVCHVFPIEFNTPAQGFVTIKTQAEVRDSYANLEMTMNLNEIHLGTPSPSKGTLVIITQVINDGSGTKQASDFTMHVAATNPSQNPFAGSDNGVAVTVDSGAYNVTEDPLSGYATTVSTNCSGTVTSGQIKFCTITNDDIMTTLTVIANVKNDNSGTNAPADFPLFIDGNPVSIGQRITVSSGAHTVSATLLSGYAASPWGYDCASGGTITVNLGQSKTCIINYDDLPPPAPSCADTVMILDRTGSMSSSDMANEKIAASSLNSLYAGVLPPALPPHLGVGSIGGLDGSAASIPLLGQLSTVYANITSAINSITSSNSSVGSDLSAGITTASNELNSARHIAGNEKVLILVSDGDPNKPSGTQPFDTGFSSPTANVQNASGDLWSNPTNAYTGADAGADSSDVLSGANRHRFFNFGFGGGTGLPAGSTVTGIEAQANAWNTSTSVGATTSPLVPSGSGTYDQWTANTGTDVSAVAGNDGDTSYIDTSVSVDTFTVANAGVPAGSTINSVTITAVARSTTAGAPLQLVAEKSGTLSLDPVPKTLTTSYTTYTRTMNTDPTGATWTLAEVNAWTSRFGVRTTNGTTIPRVTQLSVSVNYVAPSVCQLGVDLSWNAGTSWSSEKTQTLTGIEVPYVLGTASDKWGAHTWVPTDFTNANFRARVHAINPGAGCSASTIDHLDWLQVKVHYTQVVDPIQASLNAADAAKLGGIDLFTIHFGSDPGPYQGNKLLANLASGTTTVTYNSVTHQNGSLAQAGGVVSSDTGLIAPTIATAPNQWTNPTRAFVSDNSYTTDVVNGHQQGFTTFGFSIPPTAIINGIALSVETKSSDTSGCQVGAELSSNNGTSFTTTGTNAGVSGSDVAYTLGGAASLWGRSWVPSDFSNGSFVVRLQNIDPGSACVNGSTLSTDQIRARVYYTVNTENGDGDNFFIAPTSADMQGIFNFIGEQVCPAALNLASAPPPTTGTLIVMTQVINNNGGASTSADFIANISAINPSQTSFAGVASGVTVTVDPGDYSVTENSATGYNEIPGATCSSGGSLGPIVAGETRVCVLTNDDIPPPPPPPNFNINTGSWEEVPDAQ